MENEFNENPFDKETAVRPFSNGSEAMEWLHKNCEQCIHYSGDASNFKDAKCKPGFMVDLGFISSTIPLWAAKEIGCTYDALYQTIILYKKCRKLQTSADDLPF